MRKAATATSGAMSSHKPCVHTAEVLICRLCAQTVNMGMLPFVHQFWRGKPMRDETSAETGTAIQILTQEILNEIGGTVPIDLTARITARLEEAVNDMLYRERERCVAICKRRAVLWSNTGMASSPLGREESRARTNEATYIADAIRSLD
jgi:hypothetical protein